MLTLKQTEVLNSLDATAQLYAPGLNCTIYSAVSRYGAEIDIHVNAPGAASSQIADGRGHTVEEAVLNMRRNLGAIYGLSEVIASVRDDQKQAILNLTNRGILDKRTSTNAFLRIHVYSECQAQVKIEELQAAITRIEGSNEYEIQRAGLAFINKAQA